MRLGNIKEQDLHPKDLGFIIAICLFIRICFLLWNLSGLHFTPQNTLSLIYFEQGYAISAGYGYVKGETPEGEAALRDLHAKVNAGLHALPENAEALSVNDVKPDMSHPPGISILIAGIHRLTGDRSDIPLQVLAILLDIAAVCIFWWIVTTNFGSRMGFIAGLLYALFLPFAAAAVSKEPEGMMAFFVVAALACTIKSIRAKGRAGFLWHLLTGAILGLGGYLRPDYILLPVVFFPCLWIITRRFWHSMGAAATMLAAIFLVLLPWGTRNHNICGRWVFTSTMVGAVLISGLSEYENPWGFAGFDEDSTARAKALGISSAWNSEGDLYMRRLFIKSVVEQPGAYLMTILKRLPIVMATPYGFGLQNPLKTRTFSEARLAGEDRYQSLIRRPGYVLAAYWDYFLMAGIVLLYFLATLFMAMKAPQWRSILLLVASPHLYSIATHMLTHMEPRFLLPSMFCLFLGPAYLIARLWRQPMPNTI